MHSNPMDVIPYYLSIQEVTHTLIWYRLRDDNYFTCNEPYLLVYSESKNRLFGLNAKGLIDKLSSHEQGNIRFMWSGDIIDQYIAEQICEIPTVSTAMLGKEFAYETSLGASQYFYTLMKNFEKNNERVKARASLEKYIGVLRGSPYYKKQFEEIDLKFKKEGEK